MRISKDEEERRILVVPRPEAQPERVAPQRPANEPDEAEPMVEPERKVA